MRVPWAKRKMEAVAAHGWKASSTTLPRAFPGVFDRTGGLVPAEAERWRASCPVDMAIDQSVCEVGGIAISLTTTTAENQHCRGVGR